MPRAVNADGDTETKRCTKCKLRKPFSLFAKAGKPNATNMGLASECKECMRVRVEKYYDTTPEARKRNSIRTKRCQIKKTAELKQKVAEYLATHHCVDCGESDPVVLDFDHGDDSDKLACVSHLIRRRRTWAVVAAEIAKCVVRCSNCHRRRHRREWVASVTNLIRGLDGEGI